MDSLLCEAKSSYVEEWATKHAAYCQEPSPCESPESRASSKSTRRLLPSLPPGSDPQQSSLESPEHDSEDESGYMTHTKHLVDAMELRLKQVQSRTSVNAKFKRLSLIIEPLLSWQSL